VRPLRQSAWNSPSTQRVPAVGFRRHGDSRAGESPAAFLQAHLYLMRRRRFPRSVVRGGGFSGNTHDAMPDGPLSDADLLREILCVRGGRLSASSSSATCRWCGANTHGRPRHCV
jgi:hypothetical protein